MVQMAWCKNTAYLLTLVLLQTFIHVMFKNNQWFKRRNYSSKFNLTSDIVSVIHNGFKPIFTDISLKTLSMKEEDILKK